MLLFEFILCLLVGAAILAAIARRLSVPYPTLLGLGGACVALLPFNGHLTLAPPPELIMALFVAPVLLDAAHDTSLRDLSRNWRPVMALVLVAVALSTVGVAYVTRQIIPDMPWAAAIALGALLAPPDAIAAMAVLGQLKLPHRIRAVLEGESLLNDASALLIYKLAVGAVVTGYFSTSQVLPAFALVVCGSVIAGWVFAQIAALQIKLNLDAPTAVILQFALTFGVWIFAEHFGLSGVITIVVFGLAMSRHSTITMPARLRISSFAIWESATFILNVLAFTMIGLQLRPILASLSNAENLVLLVYALAILATVITIRMAWVMAYAFVRSHMKPHPHYPKLPAKAGLIVGWSGMRGIVTLAAAMALPEQFPHRDFVMLTAFIVVLGTLMLQGLTLGPLLRFLRLPQDDTITNEIRHARATALHAAVIFLQSQPSATAQRLVLEYQEALNHSLQDKNPRDTDENVLRRHMIVESRKAILTLRNHGAIGDEAYRQVEEELDWLEISASESLS